MTEGLWCRGKGLEFAQQVAGSREGVKHYQAYILCDWTLQPTSLYFGGEVGLTFLCPPSSFPSGSFSFSCLQLILRPANPVLGKFQLQIWNWRQYWFQFRAFLAEEEGGLGVLRGGCRMEQGPAPRCPEAWGEKGLGPGHFSVPGQPLIHTCGCAAGELRYRYFTTVDK